MPRTIGDYLGKARGGGLGPAVRRRYEYALGRLVELMGDRMRVEGMTFSLDSPAIITQAKWPLYFGRHEVEERELLRRWLPRDLPVVEFGGGLGLVSCLINRALERPEAHVVVEANPALIPVLERNRDLNGCRFRVVNRAIAYEMEAVELSLGVHFAATRVGGDRDARPTVTVPTTSLAELIAAEGFDQVSLVSDIEGIESALIEREIDVIRRHVRFILVEFHPSIVGQDVFARGLESLRSSGFAKRDEARFSPTDPNVTYVFTRE